MSASAHSNGAAAARAEEALRHKASQLQKFFDDVEELLHRSGKDGPDIAGMRERVESSIGRMTSSVRDGTRAAIDGTRKAAVATDEYVHKNPWIAIGAGAAAGLVVGALLMGRSRK